MKKIEVSKAEVGQLWKIAGSTIMHRIGRLRPGGSPETACGVIMMWWDRKVDGDAPTCPECLALEDSSCST